MCREEESSLTDSVQASYGARFDPVGDCTQSSVRHVQPFRFSHAKRAGESLPGLRFGDKLDFVVPGGRIELPWITPHDFESCASTNSAIPANISIPSSLC